MAQRRPTASRLGSLGPRALSPRELLAILIETGIPAAGGKPARSAMDLAGDVLKHFWAAEGPALRRLMSAPLVEICRVPGIGPAKATKMLAALEFAGRRAAEEARPERDRFRTPQDVYERMRFRLRDLRHEEFHVLLLDTQNRSCATSGYARHLDSSLVHPREVFRAAVEEAAAG